MASIVPTLNKKRLLTFDEFHVLITKMIKKSVGEFFELSPFLSLDRQSKADMTGNSYDNKVMIGNI